MDIRVCNEPGCPMLVAGGHKCETHQKAADRLRWARAEAQRPASAWRSIYFTARWRAIRRQVKAEQPWCAAAGCTQATSDADHIIPLGVWEGSPFDRSNVQGLCHKHHSEKTAQEVWGRK